MPRVIGVQSNEEIETVSFPNRYEPAPRKPDFYIPKYEQIGFDFNPENKEITNEYRRFAPFCLGRSADVGLTYSEFAVRNGFRLETGQEITEEESLQVLQSLTTEGSIQYIWSEFHQHWRWMGNR